MKRKYVDRPNWRRILEKEFSLKFVDDEDFTGYLSILQFHKVREPLIKEVGGKPVRLADDGFIWLQHLPMNENYALTTMFDQSKKVIQWYFDVTKQNGVDVSGIPFFDDLYLDVVVLPTGKVVLLDEDELVSALQLGDISQAEYDLAYSSATNIMTGIARDVHRLTTLCEKHLAVMLAGNKKGDENDIHRKDCIRP